MKRSRRGERLPLGEHNVVAVFADMTSARKAMTHLERAGVEGADIWIRGEQAERAAGRMDTFERDAEVVETVGRRVLVTGAIGTVVGGLVGFVIGLVFFNGAGIWGSLVSGAIAGGGLAGMAGATTGLDMSEAWELTFDSTRSGRVVLGVQAEDEEEAAAALEALEKTEPGSLKRFDARGRALPVG